MNIALGSLAGRFLQTPRDVVARFMFYLINPLIMFNGILHTHIDKSILTLPVLVFFLSCTLSLIMYWKGKQLWSDSTSNILAYTAGSGNSGYFGIPLALILFDNQGEGVYMLSLLGITLFENSLGFYICAKGSHSANECLQKLARLPTLYAFFIALFFNYFKFPIPEVFDDFMCHIKGTYTVLGMMIIGLGLSSLHHFKIDITFISWSFFCKFIIWPTVILSFTYLDSYWLHIFSTDVHQALILLSIVPLPVNAVIVATVVGAQPEKVAAAVMFSTLFALFYVPFMIITFMNLSVQFLEMYCPI